MKKGILIFISTMTVMACEKEVKLKQEEINPRIVVNSLFSANDTVWIHLSQSGNILLEEQLPNITNATAKLLDADDAEIATFTHTENGKYYVASPTPVAGNAYGLSVDAPNLNSVKATSETPSIITLTSIDTNSAIPNDQIEFQLKFMDDPTQKNYYGVSIVYTSVYTNEFGEVNIYDSPYFSTKEFYVVNGEPDIDGHNWGMEFYFSDEGFNGQEISFTGNQYYNTTSGLDIFYVIGLKSMSEDLYKYKLSYSKYLSTQGSPFAEPVRVHSNITDGFGIFGGSSIYRDTIFVN